MKNPQLCSPQGSHLACSPQPRCGRPPQLTLTVWCLAARCPGRTSCSFPDHTKAWDHSALCVAIHLGSSGVFLDGIRILALSMLRTHGFFLLFHPSNLILCSVFQDISKYLAHCWLPFLFLSYTTWCLLIPWGLGEGESCCNVQFTFLIQKPRAFSKTLQAVLKYYADPTENSVAKRRILCIWLLLHQSSERGCTMT